MKNLHARRVPILEELYRIHVFYFDQIDNLERGGENLNEAKCQNIGTHKKSLHHEGSLQAVQGDVALYLNVI